jgi:lipoprotein-anchoring transpeptidase ErfK/SrfK
MRGLDFSVFIAVGMAGAAAATPAGAQMLPSTPPMVVMVQAQETRGSLGGGFVEFLFGDSAPRQPMPQPQYIAPPSNAYQYAPAPRAIYANASPSVDPMLEPQGYPVDPQFERQEVAYQGKEESGTLVVDTPNHFLYLVEPNGMALRYGIGVGRPGFTWSGMHTVSAKKEWPDWGRPDQPARRARDVSRLDALSHSRLERALDHRAERVVGMHPYAQRRHHRPLCARQGWQQSHRDVERLRAVATAEIAP